MNNSTITSLYMPCVDRYHSADYISNRLFYNGIAIVNRIIMFPYFKNNQAYQKAYIYIESWLDTDIAYNFIQSLKTHGQNYMIHRYQHPNFEKQNHINSWVVKINNTSLECGIQSVFTKNQLAIHNMYELPRTPHQQHRQVAEVAKVAKVAEHDVPMDIVYDDYCADHECKYITELCDMFVHVQL